MGQSKRKIVKIRDGGWKKKAGAEQVTKWEWRKNCSELMVVVISGSGSER
jgi:hypothetical protein